MPVELRYAARSHLGLGSKSRNEDSAYAGPELLVLCDGMGGHAAGDVASSLVVGELVHLDGESHGADDMLDVLERELASANARLADLVEETDSLEGMGTTCIAMMRSGAKLAVATIGDSRAYLRRRSKVIQITKDHSFVQQLLDEGRITPEEAQHHPQRSLVTRVLTGRPDDTPDTSMRELHVGDRLLLCSDGLTDYVAESTVADLLRSDQPPGTVADALIAIALRAAVRDNVTVVVADAVNPGEGTTKPQVVGAAGHRRAGQAPGPLTAAEKAAALSREVHGQEEVAPELAEEHTSPLRAWLRRTLVALAAATVLVGVGWATYAWTQQQYFVGEDTGNVAIFRGVSQDLGPLELSRTEERTDLELETLPGFYQDQVRATLSAEDREEADAIVAELRTLALPRCSEVVGDAATATAAPGDAATATAAPDGATSTSAPDDAATTTAPAPVPTVDCVP